MRHPNDRVKSIFLHGLPARRAKAIRATLLDRASNIPDLPPEIARRRTFAIISHPDAGKTTLTEKFLLYGGAIQMAGQVLSLIHISEPTRLVHSSRMPSSA